MSMLSFRCKPSSMYDPRIRPQRRRRREQHVLAWGIAMLRCRPWLYAATSHGLHPCDASSEICFAAVLQVRRAHAKTFT